MFADAMMSNGLATAIVCGISWAVWSMGNIREFGKGLRSLTLIGAIMFAVGLCLK